VDSTGSGSRPMASFDTSSVEPSGSANRQFYEASSASTCIKT
jgi:hypothetical protein